VITELVVDRLQSVLLPLVVGWTAFSAVTSPHFSIISIALLFLSRLVLSVGLAVGLLPFLLNYIDLSVPYLPRPMQLYGIVSQLSSLSVALLLGLPGLTIAVRVLHGVIFALGLVARCFLPVDRRKRNEYGLCAPECLSEMAGLGVEGGRGEESAGEEEAEEEKEEKGKKAKGKKAKEKDDVEEEDKEEQRAKTDEKQEQREEKPGVRGAEPKKRLRESENRTTTSPASLPKVRKRRTAHVP
jgi:hypothetical protein